MREESFLKKYFQFILFNVLFICTLSVGVIIIIIITIIIRIL